VQRATADRHDEAQRTHARTHARTRGTYAGSLPRADPAPTVAAACRCAAKRFDAIRATGIDAVAVPYGSSSEYPTSVPVCSTTLRVFLPPSPRPSAIRPTPSIPHPPTLLPWVDEDLHSPFPLDSQVRSIATLLISNGEAPYEASSTACECGVWISAVMCVFGALSLVFSCSTLSLPWHHAGASCVREWGALPRWHMPHRLVPAPVLCASPHLWHRSARKGEFVRDRSRTTLYVGDKTIADTPHRGLAPHSSHRYTVTRREGAPSGQGELSADLTSPSREHPSALREASSRRTNTP
jgi:hypothetical protein